MMPGSLLLRSAGACFEYGHRHATGDCCLAFEFSPALAEETTGSLAGVTTTAFRRIRIPPHQTLPLLVADPDPLRAEALALNILGTAYAMDSGATDAPVTGRDGTRIAPVVRRIDAEFAEPLTVANLARTAGLGRRLAAAARRLRRERTSSVLEIALSVGFCDLSGSDFTRRFRARYGTPPRRYRRVAATSAN